MGEGEWKLASSIPVHCLWDGGQSMYWVSQLAVKIQAEVGWNCGIHGLRCIVGSGKGKGSRLVLKMELGELRVLGFDCFCKRNLELTLLFVLYVSGCF